LEIQEVKVKFVLLLWSKCCHRNRWLHFE